MVFACFQRFEEITAALKQEPSTTEELDALEKYLGSVQQVGLAKAIMQTKQHDMRSMMPWTC
jgi:hypothetical protein